MTQNINPGSCLTQPAFADLLTWWKRVTEALMGSAALPWYASPKIDALTPLAEFEYWICVYHNEPEHAERKWAMRQHMLGIAEEFFLRQYDGRRCEEFVETVKPQLTTDFNEEVACLFLRTAAAVADLRHHGGRRKPDPYPLVCAQAIRLIGVVLQVARLLDQELAEPVVVHREADGNVRLLLERLRDGPVAADATFSQAETVQALKQILGAPPEEVRRLSLVLPPEGQVIPPETRQALTELLEITAAKLDGVVQPPKSEPPPQL